MPHFDEWLTMQCATCNRYFFISETPQRGDRYNCPHCNALYIHEINAMTLSQKIALGHPRIFASETHARKLPTETITYVLKSRNRPRVPEPIDREFLNSELYKQSEDIWYGRKECDDVLGTLDDIYRESIHRIEDATRRYNARMQEAQEQHRKWVEIIDQWNECHRNDLISMTADERDWSKFSKIRRKKAF